MRTLTLDVDLPGNERPGRPSVNERLVHGIFGLARNSAPRTLLGRCEVPAEGLTYITGSSGSGKSSLLKALLKKYPEAACEPAALPADTRVVDSLEGALSEVIAWLGRFGLGEARILVTPCEALSVGQKERLKIARLLWEEPAVVVLDEFLSCLDRLTARVVAYQFQKAARQLHTTCYVATAHDDLTDALFPDSLLTLDFEGVHETTHPEFAERVLAESKEVSMRDGDLSDYEKLKRFHYMDSQIGDLALDPDDIVTIRAATFRGKTVGVRVFTKMFPSRFESLALFRKINELAVLSSRVIVHPAFRGLGISRHMDLPAELQGKFKKIFTHSALAAYFPFDRAGGYRAVGHVSQRKSRGQLRFVEAVGALGLNDIEALNDPALCRAFWDRLPAAQKNELRELSAEALADYDARYTLSVLGELGMAPTGTLESGLRQFFRRGLDAVADGDSWKLLSETLPFPMEGLVKDLGGARAG